MASVAKTPRSPWPLKISRMRLHRIDSEVDVNARVIGLLAGLLLAGGTPVVAHHSFAAEYDGTKPVKVSGVVTRVEWTNPHIWFYVDVKDDQGRVTNWASRPVLRACCSAAAFPATR